MIPRACDPKKPNFFPRLRREKTYFFPRLRREKKLFFFAPAARRIFFLLLCFFFLFARARLVWKFSSQKLRKTLLACLRSFFFSFVFFLVPLSLLSCSFFLLSFLFLLLFFALPLFSFLCRLLCSFPFFLLVALPLTRSQPSVHLTSRALSKKNGEKYGTTFF